jgi:acetyl-CoA carboxylase biotin carboxyl carrier protein
MQFSNFGATGETMDLKYIKELVKLIDNTSVTEIEIEKDETKLRIAKNNEVQVVSQTVAAQPVAAPVPQAAPAAAPAQATPEAADEKPSNYDEITSPMVGTYYSAPSPDADPFIKVGDSVSVGQTLCIIEAMKLMNEIKAEKSGKIAKILVENADPVEYNQALFYIE